MRELFDTFLYWNGLGWFILYIVVIVILICAWIACRISKMKMKIAKTEPPSEDEDSETKRYRRYAKIEELKEKIQDAHAGMDIKIDRGEDSQKYLLTDEELDFLIRLVDAGSKSVI